MNGTLTTDASFSSFIFSLLGTQGDTVLQVFGSSGSGGAYQISDLPSGSFYWAVTNNNFVPQIFSMVDCPAASSGNFTGCPLLPAQRLTLTSNVTLNNIDFSLRRAGARQVRVVSAKTSQPIGGVVIDIWNAARTRVGSSLTDANGLAWVIGNTSNPTQYLISTDNSLGYVDEVFNNQLCPNGSAFFGLCPLIGEPVTLPGPVSPVSVLTIRLNPIGTVFVDGFEN